jgi:hypothetical protein
MKRAHKTVTLPPDDSKVVLSFDGSYNRDCSALVGWCEIDGKPHGFVYAVWERPLDALADWVVPRGEVDLRIDEAMQRWHVLELCADKSKWVHEFTGWWERYGDVIVDLPHTPARAIEACRVMYGAVAENGITHDGSPVWDRHLSNAVVKETSDGAYIVKEGRNSPRKIDVAVAGNHGLVRWMWHASQTPIKPLAAWA